MIELTHAVYDKRHAGLLMKAQGKEAPFRTTNNFGVTVTWGENFFITSETHTKLGKYHETLSLVISGFPNQKAVLVKAFVAGNGYSFGYFFENGLEDKKVPEMSVDEIRSWAVQQLSQKRTPK